MFQYPSQSKIIVPAAFTPCLDNEFKILKYTTFIIFPQHSLLKWRLTQYPFIINILSFKKIQNQVLERIYSVAFISLLPASLKQHFLQEYPTTHSTIHENRQTDRRTDLHQHPIPF